MGNHKDEHDFSLLLDIPAELRVHIYEAVSEGEAAFLAARSRGCLATTAVIPRVNRQLREEFPHHVYLNASVIVARVYCFDFRHLVTFFNRLSAKELRSLATSSRLPDSRKLMVERNLGPIPKDLKRDHGLIIPQIGLGNFFLLRTWLNRSAHPTKKRTEVEISYLVTDIPCSPSYSDLRFWERNLRKMVGEMPAGSHQQVELMKIVAAVGEAMHKDPPE